MSPDLFMPLFGNEFFQAVEGLPEEVGFKYLRVCWHYWHHNHCKGLLNDEEFLRRLCRCERHEWPTVRQTIFDNEKFMTLQEGLWHQNRCRQEWARAIEIMENNKKRTQAANKKRWGK